MLWIIAVAAALYTMIGCCAFRSNRNVDSRARLNGSAYESFVMAAGWPLSVLVCGILVALADHPPIGFQHNQ